MTAFTTGALNPLSPSGSSADKRVYEPSMEEILASIRRIIADDQGLPGLVAAERGEASRAERPAEMRRSLAEPTDEPVMPHRLEPVVDTPEVSRHAPAPALAELTPVFVESADPRDVSDQAVSPIAPTPLAHGAMTAPQYPMPDRVPADNHDEAMARSKLDAHDRRDDRRQADGDRHSPRVEEPAPAEDDPKFDAPLEAPAPRLEAAPSLFSAATDSAVSSAFNVLAASRLADNSDELMHLVREMIRPLLRNWLDDNLPSMVERMVRAEIERVARGGR